MNALIAHQPRHVVIAIPSRRLDAMSGRNLMRAASEVPVDVRLIIDLGGVHHLDSLGIAALCRVARGRDPKNLALAALEPEALTIARITRLHEVFAIFATVGAAERASNAA